MKLMRFKTLHNRRLLKQVLFFLLIVLLLINSFTTLVYVTQNKNQIIFNSYVHKVLPLYRSLREIKKTAINLFYIPKMAGGEEIPQYELRIKRSDFEKLEEALPDSIGADIFSGYVWLDEENKKDVPAIFMYDGVEYKVDVGYRGLNPNHWTRPKRSWQIRFDKDTPFEGIRTLKLILPSDRDYFAEYLNMYRAQKFGVPTPKLRFAGLKVNGSDHGIYYAMEGWSSDFLERNKLPADSNFYSLNEVYGLNNYFLYNEEYSGFDGLEFWEKDAEDIIFPFENFAELDHLLKLLSQDNFSEVAEDIIDLENFYRWQIVSALSGSDHQDNTNNLRLYFNNSSGKFQFMQWDVEIGPYDPSRLNTATDIAAKLFENPKRLLERNQSLWEYVSDKKNLEDDLVFYDKAIEDFSPHFYADFRKHDSNKVFTRAVENIRNHFENTFKGLQKQFEEDDSRMTIRNNQNEGRITIEVSMDNFAGLELMGIEFPFDNFAVLRQIASPEDSFAQGTFIAQANANSEGMLVFNGLSTPLMNSLTSEAGGERIQYLFAIQLGNSATVINPEDIKVRFKNLITGEIVKIKDIFYVDNSTFSQFDDIQKTSAQFVREHPQFYLRGENDIGLASGTHVIRETVVVPKNAKLTISAGAYILFTQGASLISYSPIQAIGNTFSPIVFSALDPTRPWGSVAIVGTGKQASNFIYTRFQNGSGAYVNGVRYAGTLAVHHGDLNVQHSVIEGAQDDDGVNVKYGNFSIADSTFRSNSADGLDIDYSEGFVSTSLFENNGNDGIDLSGSPISIKNNRIIGSEDKCISVGERAENPIIFNNILEDCNIGIETKDGSTPLIINNLITGNTIGLNSYRKKDLFIEGGKPIVYNTILWNNEISVQDDEFSKTDIRFSTVEGGFEGEGNRETDPQSRPQIDGGNTKILSEELEIEVTEAPIGVFNTVQP